MRLVWYRVLRYSTVKCDHPCHCCTCVQNERGQLVWTFNVVGATAMYNSYK